ncbi:MAG: heme peroxidase family protein [Pseudomonadota bacterium]
MLINKRHGAPLELPTGTEGGPFGYFFPDAPSAPPGMTDALDALASAMVDHADVDDGNSDVPAAYTYFGQFIDHDVTANTDRETDFSSVEGEEIIPAHRSDVTAAVRNLRTGRLELDSLYGDRTLPDPYVQRFAAMLRHPTLPAKMWLGTLEDQGFGRPPLPADPAADLLRLDRVIQDPHQQITPAEIRALPPSMREAFVRDDGSLRVQRAIIGDSRNDENLAVAQFHVGMLRFHNKVVDTIGDQGGPEATFTAAQTVVRWTYQWLVVNDYLPRMCGEAVVHDVLVTGAPLYSDFAQRMGSHGAHAPLPLEFSVAAFRFGHTLVRPSYDWSRLFGRPEGSAAPLAPRASFADLFRFTGNGGLPMAVENGVSTSRLPAQWPIEWARFVDENVETPDRFTRRFDTRLAPDLGDMFNEGGVQGDVLRVLARRNLRRGYRLNLPTAQDCIAGVQERVGVELPALGSDVLTSGDTGVIVAGGGLLSRTPLWFYVLKEAEAQENGLRLGPLGARLVAETLIGLIQTDPCSYWNAPGSDSGRWQPVDGPTGELAVLADLLRFAELI